MSMAIKVKNTVANLIRNTPANAFFKLPEKILSVDDYCLQYCATYSPQKEIIYPSYFLEEEKPATIHNEISRKFLGLIGRNVHEAFVIQLKNGNVYGLNGAIVTEEAVLLRDVSREFGKRNSHSIFERALLPKATHQKGNVAVLATAGANTYYHWLVDILPRIHLLAKADLLSRIDYFVMPAITTKFQRETLAFFEINESKIIEAKSTDFCLQAENLFVPSLPSLLGTVNKWTTDFLREKLLSSALPDVSTGNRIYITRSNASSRRLLNEQKLIEFLQVKDFDIIDCEAYSVLEQAAIFRKADLIVAPHGSGLTNIIFCDPGATVIELFSSTYIVPCYWTIANGCSLKYHYAHNEETDLLPNEPYWNGKQGDFIFPEEKLAQILELSGIL